MNYKELIESICQEEKINLQILSNNYIFALTKNGITKYIWGHKFPLNDHGIGNIIDDKYALYTVCKNFNIPIIEHRILWNPHNKLGKYSYELLQNYFNEFNKDVVIKPNNGSKGLGVSHHKDLDNLKNACDNLWQKHFSISICPFYKIDKEYRVIILDDEIKLMYEKSKPQVIGDGKSTIKELLESLNEKYFFKHELTNEYDKVLKKGEVFEYDWHFNLSKGATADYIKDEDLKCKISNLALKVTRSLGVKFVSVDIISSNKKLFVMEVNSGVCIDKVCNFLDSDKSLTKEIYRSAIKKMFD